MFLSFACSYILRKATESELQNHQKLGVYLLICFETNDNPVSQVGMKLKGKKNCPKCLDLNYPTPHLIGARALETAIAYQRAMEIIKVRVESLSCASVQASCLQVTSFKKCLGVHRPEGKGQVIVAEFFCRRFLGANLANLENIKLIIKYLRASCRELCLAAS